MASSLINQVLSKQRVQLIQSPTGTVITLDACVQETHQRESPPTEFEIEDGQTISDHIIVKPFSLELHGIISDTPLSLEGAALTTALTAFTPAPAIVGGAAAYALFSAVSDTQSPSQVAFKQLLELQENKQPFEVLTTLRQYKNMWIKSLSVHRDSSTGKILDITLSLVQLLLVSPQTVNLQIFKDSDLAASIANQGKQQMNDLGIAKDAAAGRVRARVLTGTQ